MEPMRYTALKTCRLVFFALAASILCAMPLAHAQVSDLDRHMPTLLEDQRQSEQGEIDLQLPLVFTTDSDTDDVFTLYPQVQYGFTPRWQGSLTVPVILTDEDLQQRGSGDVELATQVLVKQESPFMPGLSLIGRLVAPTGEDSEGVDGSVTAIIEKLVPGVEYELPISLNATWFFNNDAEAFERDNGLELVAGIHGPLSANMVAIFDFVYQQTEFEDLENTLLEAGVRYGPGENTILALGVGAGLTDESEDFKVTAAIEQSF